LYCLVAKNPMISCANKYCSAPALSGYILKLGSLI
jgi:hypothetical protein